jgi:hypothetical protein
MARGPNILQALATLAALAQISTPSAAHFLKSLQLLVQKFAADRDRQKGRVFTRRLFTSERGALSRWGVGVAQPDWAALHIQVVRT